MCRWSIALVVLAALSCKRPIGVDGKDAGAPSISDAAHTEAARADLPLDVTPDATVDVAVDAAADATSDLSGDATVDAAAAVCPAGVLPLDVCDCGCCGGFPDSRACYYPSRGETRDAIPNPMSTPSQCAFNGCTEGTRHLCCADPGAQPATAPICGNDTSIEDWRRFTVTRRDGAVCTTLELCSAGMFLPIVGPPGCVNTNGWRQPCDGSTPRVYAIGGLGQVTPGTSGTLLPFPRYDVHAALFFDNGTGVADAVRIDKDDVAIGLACAGGVCPPCGSICTFDTTYSCTTSGGLGAVRDSFALSPPASYVHKRSPEALPYPEVSCAPAIPVCGGAAIDVDDIMSAFADPDVQAAFARSTGAGTLPFYGEDHRGGDGPAFQITRGGGGGFLVGAPCPTGSTSPCMAIPAGVQHLVVLLSLFDQQQMFDPSCVFPQP